jgi:hypothetical protein
MYKNNFETTPKGNKHMNNSKLEILVLSVVVIIFFIVLLGFDFGNYGEGNVNGISETHYAGNLQMTNSAAIYLDNMNGANDTSALKSRGYKVYNRGTSPQGVTATWFQGNPALFNAYEGPTTGYVACNFRIASYLSTIDSWLVTPKMSVFTGDTLSFYSRSKDNSPYPDSFRVMYSPSGDSVPEAEWTELGRFKVSTTGWVLKKFIATATGGNARFAIRYRIANAGPGSTNGEYSGIDLLQVSRGPGACQFSWSQRIVVTDAGNVGDSLRFGVSSAGTNGIDTCLREYSMPPAPPAGAFDCRFILPINEAVRTDIRNDSLVNRTWRMTFQPSTGYPMTFNWNPSTLPASGSFTLKDEVNGTIVNINMRNQTSYTLTNSGIASLKIEYLLYTTLSVPVYGDWNILSVPLLAADMTYNVLFPGGASPAYGYNYGYFVASVLSNGKGYWMKFNSANNFQINGNPFQPEQMNVNQDWNIVGTFTRNIPVSTMLSSPPGIITSVFYGYNNGYVPVDTLKVGKGYWVRTTATGYLYSGSGDNIPAEIICDPYADFTELALNTEGNGSAKLYMGDASAISTDYALPPVPPSGIFDARFATDKLVEDLGKTQTIRLNSAQGATTLKIHNAKGMVFRVKDAIDGSILNKELAEGDEVIIPANLENLIIDSNLQTPDRYELSQNYPNPFNPVTMIKYQIPVTGKVKLVVFDALGREVKTLVNTLQTAGVYEVRFDASSIASGVYFYRMTSGEFEDLKKLVVLR